jgi:hypothetical protein
MNEITPANGALMSFIERAAKDDSFDVAKFGELLRLQRDVEHDHARKMFNQAMAAAQSEMQSVVRDAKNSHLNNKYAKLETIDAAMRPIYTRNGFSVRFGSAPAPHEGWMRITCTVAHEGGYFEENYLDSPVTTTGSQGGRMAMTPVQAIGSTVTYLRRYLLSMVMNVVLADDDDDGEGMRSQPAATPRYQRKVDPTPYDAEPAERPRRTDEQWEVWVAKLQAACAVLKHRQEVVEIGNKPSVRDAIRDAPDRFKRDISAILAEAFERFPAEPGDDLDEVVIAGEEKVGAG